MTHSVVIKARQVLLGCAVSLSALLISSANVARASTTGFTGSFSFDNTSSDPTYWTPNTKCSIEPPVAEYCVEFEFNDPQSTASFSPTAGNEEFPATTTWTWTNNSPQSYFVSFDWALFKGELSPESNFAVSANNALVANTPSGTVTDQVIRPNNSLVFTISGVSDNITYLEINNFNYSVPGPLPAAGAATAFGYSRRMRKRIKGEQHCSVRQRATSTHPAAYLGITASSIQHIPTSFCYSKTSNNIQTAVKPQQAGRK